MPDIYSVPKEIAILPLETDRENLAVFNSKAVGEPPLMYGIGAYFAIRTAINSFTQQNSPPYKEEVSAASDDGVVLSFDAPFTAEKVLLNLYKKPVSSNQ